MRGLGDAADLLRETDSDLLLALQAVNNAAAVKHDEDLHRLARMVVHELGKSMK